jgi:hypothetical protein
MVAELQREAEIQAAIAAYGRDSAMVANLRRGYAREAKLEKLGELELTEDADRIMRAWDTANPIRNPISEWVKSAIDFGDEFIAARLKANAVGQAMLADLREEEALRVAILLYGENSVEAAEARWAVEKRALATQLEASGIAGVLRDEIMAAARASLDAENATAAWADRMSGVRSEIDAILGGLTDIGGAMISNAAKQVEIDALRAGKGIREAARDAKAFKREIDLTGREAGASWFERIFVIPAERGVGRYGDLLDETLDLEREAARKRDREDRGAGVKQQNALDRLINSQRTELAVMRATDPVQKEMLKNREALAAATRSEISLVEELIKERLRETVQMEALQESYDFFGTTANSFFDDLIVQGKDLDDIIGNLAGSLASAALQATILGTGPLASLFGTAGTDGLFGSLFGAIFKAEGGIVDGPGGPTEDKVMMFASPGEYVVRASQTARHRALLESINSGAIDRLPAFAAGGEIGPIVAPPAFTVNKVASGAAAPGQGTQRVLVELSLSGDLDARIENQSSDVAVRVVREGIEDFSNTGLVHRVQQIAEDERAIG